MGIHTTQPDIDSTQLASCWKIDGRSLSGVGGVRVVNKGIGKWRSRASNRTTEIDRLNVRLRDAKIILSGKETEDAELASIVTAHVSSDFEGARTADITILECFDLSAGNRIAFGVQHSPRNYSRGCQAQDD